MIIRSSRLLKPVLIGGLATIVNCASCAPDSELGNDLLHLLTGITSGGTSYPDYPPYQIDETEEGKSQYPVKVIAWDDVDNWEALVGGSGSRNRTYATINGTNRDSIPDGVENGVIVEFDHVISGNNHEGATGDDLSIGFVTDAYDYRKNYAFGIYFAFPGTAMWKGNEKSQQYNGWKYLFHRIHYVDVYGGFNKSFSLDVEHAVRDAGRGSRYIAILNFGANPIKVQSIIDLNAD